MHAVTLTINPALDAGTSVGHVMAVRKLQCGPAGHEPGGGGINVARVLKRFGSEASAVFPVGGPTGDILIGLLRAEGIVQQPIAIQGWTRENFTVDEESSNHQDQFILPGPSISAEYQRRCLDAIRSTSPSPAYIVASGSLSPGVPDGFYAEVVRIARELGARVLLDLVTDA